MENQNKKWNKELVYSFIFFVAAFTWSMFNPFRQIRDLMNSNYSVLPIGVAGFSIFIILSLYFSIKAFKKAPKGIRNIHAQLAVMFICLSLGFIILMIYILSHLGSF